MLEALTALVFCPLSILSPSNPPSSSIVRTFPSLSPYNHNASTKAYALTSLAGFRISSVPFTPSRQRQGGRQGGRDELMPGSPEKATAKLMKRPSVVGSLRTGDVKGAVTGVLSAAPLMETKKEKAARHWGVLRSQAPPSFLAQGSPRCRPKPNTYPNPNPNHNRSRSRSP